jgi:hypothetical protein
MAAVKRRQTSEVAILCRRKVDSARIGPTVLTS